jgi:hypothetical protein
VFTVRRVLRFCIIFRQTSGIGLIILVCGARSFSRIKLSVDLRQFVIVLYSFSY